MKASFGWLHNLNAHRKLLLVVVGSCCISILTAGVTLFVCMTIVQRQSFEDDASAMAEIIAANCAGSVAFADHDATTALLIPLKTKGQIVGAAIRLPDGKIFSEVGRTDLLGQEHNPSSGRVWRDKNYLVLSSPIVQHGRNIGTFHLVSDYGPVYGKLFRTYALFFALTFAGAVWMSFGLASRARRFITDPISSLADSVKELSENQEWCPVPASEASGGEVAQIAEAFNARVDRVKADAELTEEIAERRRVEVALRESEERFRSLFENAAIGLYRSSQEGEFLMANQALLTMLGCGTFEELLRAHASIQVGVLQNYRWHFRECLERIGMIEETEVQWRRCDGKIITVRESAKAIRDKAGKVLYFEGCVEDITARKEASAELQRLHRELVDASRTAGMAEVATGVLHNVGNVLNSVSVSAQLLQEQLGLSKFASLQQGVALMDQNAPQLASFLTEDPKGKLLPGFLSKVTQHVAGEHKRWHAELLQLQSNIEHMKEVVAMQQDYARVSDASQPLSAAELLEEALRMNYAGLTRNQVRVERDYQEVPPVMVDKHKVLQILVNLICNAKHALDDGPSSDKRLKLKIYKNGSGRVKILVSDNGMGIPPENLTRIFQHGFTTRRDGHGFGLHSGAIAAKLLGGDLQAESDGPGLGATFTLELPVAGAKN